MKLLFCDFDGVFNCGDGAALEGQHDPASLDPSKFALANIIVARTGAKVVISSSWRTRLDERGDLAFPLSVLREMCADKGFTGEILGVTPRLHRTPDGVPQTRGDEIRVYIDACEEPVEAFAILDDAELTTFGALAPHVVQTSMSTGLLPAHVDQAVLILTMGHR